MSDPAQDHAEHALAVIDKFVESAYAPVLAVRDAALSYQRAALESGRPLRHSDVRGLKAVTEEVLRAPDALVVGIGLVWARRALSDHELWLEWWQWDPENDSTIALEPDLKPDSLGFYDYTTAEWFDNPRRSGHRHVMGPYVDVYGTGRYLLTFTVPVESDGEFLGVAGADVPVASFESAILRDITAQGLAVTVLDPNSRVILSTSAAHMVGTLVGDPAESDCSSPALEYELRSVPWRLRIDRAVDALR